MRAGKFTITPLLKSAGQTGVNQLSAHCEYQCNLKLEMQKQKYPAHFAFLVPFEKE
jgi:hypothetical protein